MGAKFTLHSILSLRSLCAFADIQLPNVGSWDYSTGVGQLCQKSVGKMLTC